MGQVPNPVLKNIPCHTERPTTSSWTCFQDLLYANLDSGSGPEWRDKRAQIPDRVRNDGINEPRCRIGSGMTGEHESGMMWGKWIRLPTHDGVAEVCLGAGGVGCPLGFCKMEVGGGVGCLLGFCKMEVGGGVGCPLGFCKMEVGGCGCGYGCRFCSEAWGAEVDGDIALAHCEVSFFWWEIAFRAD